MQALLIAWYVIASAITFCVYARDKAAARATAQRNARNARAVSRTPENTLHLLSLIGGWPGAFLGQQIWRHKTRKLPFQLLFWTTVVINCAALFFLAR